MVAQIFACGAVFLDRTGGRDVVGGDRIEEQAENARVDDILDRLAAFRHVFEIRRVLHVGGTVVPLEGQSALDGDLAPVGVALEHIGVFFGEHLLVDALADHGRDLFACRPDIAQIDLAAFLVGAERSLGDVDLHRTGNRVGDDERRRRQVVGAHVGVDAAFEVAIAGQHRGRHQVVLVDRFGNLLGQRTRIADAGGAAEADEIEAQRIEIFLQPRLLVIFFNHLRARRERRLDPRLDREPLLDRFLGKQAGADHHARIRRVGARGDRRDDDIAVTNREIAPFDRYALAHLGGLVELLVHRLGEAAFDFLEREAILRTLRPGERRLD